MRYGAQLTIWLDFLGIRQNELADATGFAPTYVSAIIRGGEKGGIDKPSDKNQKKIFKVLTAKWGKKVDRDVFWQGPPALTQTLSSTSTTELAFALKHVSFDGTPLSSEEQEQVLHYAAFIRSQRQNGKSRSGS